MPSNSGFMKSGVTFPSDTFPRVKHFETDEVCNCFYIHILVFTKMLSPEQPKRRQDKEFTRHSDARIAPQY